MDDMVSQQLQSAHRLRETELREQRARQAEAEALERSRQRQAEAERTRQQARAERLEVELAEQKHQHLIQYLTNGGTKASFEAEVWPELRRELEAGHRERQIQQAQEALRRTGLYSL